MNRTNAEMEVLAVSCKTQIRNACHQLFVFVRLVSISHLNFTKIMHWQFITRKVDFMKINFDSALFKEIYINTQIQYVKSNQICQYIKSNISAQWFVMLPVDWDELAYYLQSSCIWWFMVILFSNEKTIIMNNIKFCISAKKIEQNYLDGSGLQPKDAGAAVFHMLFWTPNTTLNIESGLVNPRTENFRYL